MKTNNPLPSRFAGALLATTVSFGVLPSQSVHADIIDWNGADANWSSGSNWGGGNAPTASDIARFNLATYPANPNAGTTSIAGLVIGDGSTGTAALTIAGSNLTLGASGIVMNALAGLTTISSTNLLLNGNQSWSNYSSNDLVISGATKNSSSSTPVTLTLGGSGNIQFNGNILDNGTGTTALVVNKSSGSVVFNGEKNFTGGIVVKSGTIVSQAGTTPFGKGSITLGDTSGSADVMLVNNVSSTYGLGTNPGSINVVAGSTGNVTIASGSAGAISGAISIQRNVTLATLSTARLFISGGISGTGDVNLTSKGGAADFELFTHSLDFTGKLTADSSVGKVTINGGIGAGVTEISHNGSKSFSIGINALNVGNSGKRLIVGPNAKDAMTISGGVQGTGDLILENNGSGAGTVLMQFFDGDINLNGRIINKGTGADGHGTILVEASTLISGVSAIIQDSATSAFNVRGRVTVNSAGTSLVNNGGGTFQFSGGTDGTGDLYLENNSSSSAFTIMDNLGQQVGALNHAGRIVNQGTGTGSVALTFRIDENVTGIVQDSSTSLLNISFGTNAFTGDVTVNSGTVAVSHGTALKNNTLDVRSGGAATVTSGTLGGLAGSGSVSLAANSALNVGFNNKNTAFSGTINGTNLTFNKIGTGRLKLGGNHSFLVTNVSAGTLLIDNNIADGISALGAGNINVTGGAFGGNGLVRPGTGKAITVGAGAYIVAGDHSSSTFGKLVFDGSGTTSSLLTMATDSKFSFRIGENFSSDTIDFWNYNTGDFVRNNNVVEISLLGGVEAGTYNLFNFYEDNGEVLMNRGFSSGLSLVFVGDYAGLAEGYLEFGEFGQINLELTYVPEPSTWALLGGGALGLAFLRRRSHKVAKVAKVA